MVKSAFLRSINIQLDVGHPERLQHFRPTSKSVRLISSLLKDDGGNALFVVAPYGSGKSLAAGYVGELVENRPAASDVLSDIGDRITSIDPKLAEASRRRQVEGTKGLFVPLYGHVPSAPRALKEGILTGMKRIELGREARPIKASEAETAHDLVKLISECSKKLDSKKCDRLVIVWDEFGRHLQGLISEGRSEELDVLQVLAEVVSRPSAVPVSLVLLLHRSLLGYASGLPSGVRREWAKIEGRFETLQYVDDSTELYELVGSLVEETRTVPKPTDIDFAALGRQAQEVGLFPDVKGSRLKGLLAAAYPLEPSTLYLLPRVSARVAQNERTLFSFLHWISLEEAVRPGAIGDYFQGDFRTDGGPGGTQKPWLETESALQKIEEESIDEQALKCAFLLGLGLGGERAQASHAQLTFALEAAEEGEAPSVLKGLIDRKLLVHRRHTDQVVVWHGTDVDLRGRLEDSIKQSSTDFQLAHFLTCEMPPPVWRPVEYNARHGIRRYLESQYLTVAQLKAFLELDKPRLPGLEEWDGLELGSDGQVLYVLPQGKTEVAEANAIARNISDPRLFIVIGDKITALRGAALELECLLQMHEDHELISSDPLVKAELDHLTDDARIGLQPLVDRVLLPQPEGSSWFHMGEQLPLTNVVELRRKLSDTMSKVFCLTPEIDSEMVVRRKPSSVVVNARKKVELGLLERYGQEELGIDGGFADKAIFRCVFVRTGLYRENGNRWALADPDELDSPGLKSVWNSVRRFFTEPGTRKSLRTLIDELREPPYGVREGIIPLLLTAGIQAFPSAIALRKNGVFIDDILPSVIEDASKNPDSYFLEVVRLKTHQKKYLKELAKLFEAESDNESTDQTDLLRTCMDAVLEWQDKLPASASKSRHLSVEAQKFKAELDSPDPVHLFLDKLPELIGHPTNHHKKLLAGIECLRDELEGIQRLFESQAIKALGQTLVSRGIRNGAGVRAQSAEWANHFPKSFNEHLPTGVTKSVLMGLRAGYRNDGTLVNALSTLLIGHPIREWDD
ncbi:MAG TPA: hypothetical protein DIT46_04630, partial [Gemmatimonadetes bacterium]|nr:hypothetical protein [Gemmatimonadota bacterium]